MNALQKRHNQKLAWHDSITNKAPSDIRKAKKIVFDDNIKFLAACRNLDFDEMQAILSRGINIDVCNTDGMTALHRACLNNDLEVAQFLVEHGADMNRPDNEGMTPLHDAVINGYLEIIKYLVEKGARLDAVNNDNELPIELVDEEDTEVKKYLIKCMKDRSIDADTVKNKEQQIMLKDAQHWFVEGTYDPPVDPVTRATPLHIASSKNYVDVMTILLQMHGVEVDAVDRDGWTPLHCAAHWGHKEACELLLKKGADINATTYTNQSIVDVASPDLEDFLKDATTKVGTTRRLSRPNHRLSTSEKQLLMTKSLVEEGKTLRNSGVFDSSISSSIPSDPSSGKPLKEVPNLSVSADEGKAFKNSEAIDTSISSHIPPDLPSAKSLKDASSLSVSPDDGNEEKRRKNYVIIHSFLPSRTPSDLPSAKSLKEAPSLSFSVNERGGDSKTVVSTDKKAPVPDLTTLPPTDSVETASTTSTPISQKSQTQPTNSCTQLNNNLDHMFALDDDQLSVEMRLKRMSAVLAPAKGEMEAQRTSKARQARASRRSTQGVSLEDMTAAKNMNLVPTPAPSSQPPFVTIKSTPNLPDSSSGQGDYGKSSPMEEPPDTPVIFRKSCEIPMSRTASLRGSLLDEEDESIDQWVKKRRGLRTPQIEPTTKFSAFKESESPLDNTTHITDASKPSPLTKLPPSSDTTDGTMGNISSFFPSNDSGVRVSSDLPASFEFVKPLPPATVSKPSHVQLDHSVLSNSNSAPLSNTSHTLSVSDSKSTLENYEALYRRTLAEKEQLEREIARLKAEKETSEKEIARLKRAQTVKNSEQISLSKTIEYEELLREMKTLKEQNAKMKEENVAMLNVVRRLSNSIVPPSTPSGSATTNASHNDYRA